MDPRRWPFELSDFLRECPGECGKLARAINQSLQFPRAGIALPAAIALFGMLKCDRVISPLGVHPNIYTCSIALSGSGKTTAQKIVQKILSDNGLIQHIMKEPMSDSGLMGALKAESRRLMLWDECGYAIDALAKGQDFKSGMLPNIMDLYSTAGTLYVGREYSPFSNRQRIDLEAPFLNIFGASTPVRFFEALNDKFIFDGLLPRWLIFVSEESAKLNEKPVRFVMTDELATLVQAIQEGSPAKSGNLAKIFKQERQVADFGDFSFQKIAQRYEQEQVNDPLAANFWSRAQENTAKLAMILSDSPVIDRKITEFAADLVEFLIERLVDRVRDKLGTKSPKQKAKEKFFSLVTNKGMSHSNLLRLSRRVDATTQEKRNWIAEFIEAGTWQESSQFIGDSQKKSVIYYSTEQEQQSDDEVFMS